MKKQISAAIIALLLINLVPIPVVKAATPTYTSNVIPAKTSNTSPGGYTTSAGSTYGGGDTAWRVFDNNSATYWRPGAHSTFPQWLKVDMSLPKVISKYTIKAMVGYNAETPKNFSLQGSNDNSTWVDIDNQTNITLWSSGETKIFETSNQDAYRYYRVYISASNAAWTYIDSIEMMGWYDETPPGEVENVEKRVLDDRVELSWDYPSDTDIKAVNIYRDHVLVKQVTDFADAYIDNGVTESTSYDYTLTVVDDSGNESSGESFSVKTVAYTDNVIPSMTADNKPGGFIVSATSTYGSGNFAWHAFDNNASSYWRPATTNVFPVELKVDMTRPRAISKYTIKSLTSNQARTPSQFTLQGSNDNSTWTVLDTRTGETGWSSGQKRAYPFINHTPYQYYKLSITGTNDAWLYIEQVEMMGLKDQTAPSEISSLKKSIYDDRIRLSWNNPSEFDFYKVNIYRDGTLVKTVSDFTNSYIDTGLAPSTYYDYKITTLDDSGNESGGITFTTKTILYSNDVVPKMTSNTSVSPVVISASSTYGGGNSGWNIFDDSAASYWRPSTYSVFPQWIAVDFGVDKVISKYTMTSTSPTSTTVPKTFELQASVDNSTWVTLDRKENETGWTGGEKRSYPFFNYTPYQYYRIFIEDSNNAWTYIAEVELMEMADAIEATEVGGLRETNNNSRITLTWNNPTDDHFEKVNVYRNGVFLGSTYSNTYKDTSFSLNTIYTYTVKAVDDLGGESVGKNIVVDTAIDLTPPAVPSGVVVVPNTKQLAVSWDSNHESDFEGYNVYLDGVKQNTGLLPTPSYTITGLVNEQTYQIELTSVDVNGNESATSAAVASSPIHIAPAMPADLSAVGGDGNITLSWTPNSEDDIGFYYIYRDGIKVAEVPAAETTTVISGLTNMTTYNFTISAISIHALESIQSAQVSVFPFKDVAGNGIVYVGSQTFVPVSTTTLLTNGILTDNVSIRKGTTNAAIWIDFDEPVTIGSYQVYASGSGNGIITFYDQYGKVKYTGTMSRNTVTNVPVMSDITRVAILNSSIDWGVAVNEVKFFERDDVVPPNKPQGIVTASGDGRLILNWAANSDSDIWSYNVYVNGQKYNTAPIYGVNGNIIEGLTNDESYIIEITAVDKAGNESVKSASVTAVPNEGKEDLVLGKVFNYGSSINTITSTTTKLTDDDDITFETLPHGSFLWYEFDTTVSVGGYKFVDLNTHGDPVMYLYDKDGVVLKKVILSIGDYAKYHFTLVDGVKKVAIYNEDLAGWTVGAAQLSVYGYSDEVPPGDPSNIIATIDGSSVKLTWNDSADFDFKEVVIYKNGVAIGTSNNGTFTDTNANYGESNTYTLKTRDTSFNLSSGKSVIVDMPPVLDTTAPSNVSNLREEHTETTIHLSWSNPVDADFKEVGIYRDGKLVGYSSDGTFVDTLLEPGKTYVYTIKSIDETGNVSSGQTLITKTSVDKTPPNEVSNLKETHNDRNVTLTWDNPTNSDFDRVIVYRDGIAIGYSKTGTFTDTVTKSNQKYTYTIKTIDQIGNTSSGKSISVKTDATVTTPASKPDTTPPSEVGNLKENHTSKTVTLTWNNPGDNDFDRVIVYRDGIAIGYSSTGTYTDTGLNPGQSYTYTLKTMDQIANQSTGKSIKVTTNSEKAQEQANKTEQPSPISDLKKTITENQITYTFTRATENSYVAVYSEGKLVDQVTANEYKVTIPYDTAYEYTFVVVSDKGKTSSPVKDNGKIESPKQITAKPASEDSSLQTPVLEVTPKDGEAVLTWDPSPSKQAEGYYVYQDGKLIASLDKDTTTYTVEQLDNGKEYHFELVVYDKNKNTSKPSPPKLVKPELEGPQNLVIKQEKNKIVMNWDKATSPNVEGFYIYKNGEKIATVSKDDVEFIFSGIKRGENYQFEVVSFDKKGMVSRQDGTTPVEIQTKPLFYDSYSTIMWTAGGVTVASMILWFFIYLKRKNKFEIWMNEEKEHVLERDGKKEEHETLRWVLRDEKDHITQYPAHEQHECDISGLPSGKYTIYLEMKIEKEYTRVSSKMFVEKRDVVNHEI